MTDPILCAFCTNSYEEEYTIKKYGLSIFACKKHDDKAKELEKTIKENKKKPFFDFRVVD